MTEAKKMILSAVAISILAIVGFLFWYVPHYSNHAIIATKECADIYTVKGPKYFEGTGKDRFLYSPKLNTCLIFNTLQETGGNFHLLVVDMISDKILFAYDLNTGESKDAKQGLTREQALDRVRSYGFFIF